MNSRHKTSGFTLIEMLAVVFIIAILVTIIVGVAALVQRRQGVERTRTNMGVIHAAIEKFNEETGNYPEELLDSLPPAGWPLDAQSQSEWYPFNRGAHLYRQLMIDPAPAACRARLRDLTYQNDAIITMQGTRETFADGFKKYLDYRRSEGAGGTPLLLSAGADGQFNTQDDIRSDNR